MDMVMMVMSVDRNNEHIALSGSAQNSNALT
jgi:hypothetical protein